MASQMSDQDFEDKINQLGLTVPPAASTSADATASFDPSVQPTQPQDNSDRLQQLLTGAVKPQSDADFQMLQDYLSSPDQSKSSTPPPAGFDGSPEANPNIPVPPEPGTIQIASNDNSLPSGSVSQLVKTSDAPGRVPGVPDEDSGPTNSTQVPSAQPDVNQLVSNPELNDSALKNAQQQAQLGTLAANIGEGFGTLAAVGSGDKFDPSFYKSARDQAQQPVQDIQARRDAMVKNTTLSNALVSAQINKLSLQDQQQAADPNSSVSKTSRGIYEMFHPGIQNTPGWKDIPAKDLKEFGQHILETEAKLEQSKATREYANSYRQSQADAKQANQDNKDFINFGNKIEGGIASSRATFGKNSNVLRQADAAQQLLNQVKDQPGGADQRQYFELARNLDAMLSQGSGTITGTKELLPNTSGKKAASIEEWLSNKPQPADLQAFTSRVQDTINRERNYAVKNNADTIARIAPGYSHLKDKDTDRWNSILGAHGIQTNDSGDIVGFDAGSNSKQGGLQASPGTQPVSQTQSSPSDSVNVISPEGTPGTIPKANLDKALARGFKVAQ